LIRTLDVHVERDEKMARVLDFLGDTVVEANVVSELSIHLLYSIRTLDRKAIERFLRKTKGLSITRFSFFGAGAEDMLPPVLADCFASWENLESLSLDAGRGTSNLTKLLTHLKPGTLKKLSIVSKADSDGDRFWDFVKRPMDAAEDIDIVIEILSGLGEFELRSKVWRDCGRLPELLESLNELEKIDLSLHDIREEDLMAINSSALKNAVFRGQRRGLGEALERHPGLEVLDVADYQSPEVSRILPSINFANN
jgi:hypothetical protein